MTTCKNNAPFLIELNSDDDKVLSIIRKAGKNGATVSPMRQYINAFKGAKGKLRLVATLEKLVAAGLIKSDSKYIKYGTRFFYVEPTNPEPPKDEESFYRQENEKLKDMLLKLLLKETGLDQ